MDFDWATIQKAGPVLGGISDILATWKATQQRDPYKDMPWLRTQQAATADAIGRQQQAAELMAASMDPNSAAFKNTAALIRAKADQDAVAALNEQMQLRRRRAARGYGGVKTGTEDRDMDLAFRRMREQISARAGEQAGATLQRGATGLTQASTASGTSAYYGGQGMNPLTGMYSRANPRLAATRMSAIGEGLRGLFGKVSDMAQTTPGIPPRKPAYPEYDLG